MELREFAEQVLFSTSLEEKLSCPDLITDEQAGSAIGAPHQPGRPAHLRIKSKDTGSPRFPGLHELEQESHRSRLLHFFANHELLATELMALVLLKFPEAPKAFRRGVLQTLKDEQAHTRMYLARMRASGMAFGELPLSGYFWKMVSPMEHPIDYVSSLCLTFEQANLDFAKYFAGEFETVGDKASAKLMNRIYRDEIGHVAYGLKWFRRWKDPSQSDWEAFCRQLKFPLSPQRAKGLSINAAGREAAGLDAEFIAQLSVYSQSRGRTPNVFVFNPLAEGYIAHGDAFHPVAKQEQLAEDLENLPQFLCRRDDVVLVRRKPSVQFLNSLQRAGLDLPEFVELRDGAIPRDSNLPERKLNDLRPWAWSPDSARLLAPLLSNVSDEQKKVGPRFSAHIAELYSKCWSAEVLRRCLESQSDNPRLCTLEEVGVGLRDVDSVYEKITELRSHGSQKLVVKEAVGVAGSNAIRLWEPELLPTQRTWIERTLECGGELVVEPWLERLADFSVQLEMGKGGLKVFGYTGLINDLKGQFKGNWAEPNFRRRIPATVLSHFDRPHEVERMLAELYATVFGRLELELKARGFVGPLGIDALVYRDQDGRPRVKPIVEINPRYTMGRLTVELMKQVAPGCRGEFRIVNVSDLKHLGFPDFVAYASDASARDPVRLIGSPKPRISGGTIALSDPQSSRVALAVFSVAQVG